MHFKTYLVFRAERQRTFQNVLHFFLAKSSIHNSALALTFYNVQVAWVTWYKIRAAFPLHYSHSRRSFCGVTLFARGRVLEGYFAVPVFLKSLNSRIWWGSIQSSSYPGITRPLQLPECVTVPPHVAARHQV